MTVRIFKSTLFLLLSLVTISCNSQKVLTEKDLLKDHSNKDLDRFGSFLWTKNSDSVLVINENNFNRILNKTTSGDDGYFVSLFSYSIHLNSKNKKIAKELSFAERAKVAAYVVDYLYRCQEKMKNEDSFKDIRFVNRVLNVWNRNKYDEEFKKHDYYGLELLKKHHLEKYRYLPNIEDYQLKPRRSDSQD